MAAITAALIAAAATVAATATTIGVQRSDARDARIDQSHRMGQARQDAADAQTQQQVTMAARAARQRQLSMSGGGYGSTIQTSPLGLSGGTADAQKTKLGE